MQLAIDRAATIQSPVAYRRFKGVSVPAVGDLGRLHIIMAIDQDRWRALAGAMPFAERQRAASLRHEDHFGAIHADAQHHRLKPLGGARDILRVPRLRANRADAQQLLILVEESCLARLGIFVRVAHVLPRVWSLLAANAVHDTRCACGFVSNN